MSNMNVTAITAKTHRLTKADTTTYPDANILIDLNMIVHETNLKVLRWQGYKDFAGNTAKLDLADWTAVAEGALGYNGEVPFPDDLLDLVKLEIKYDEEMLPVTVYSRYETSYSENDNINDNFSTSNPLVRFERGSMFLRPIPSEAVTGGLIIEYKQRQEALTTGTDVPLLEESFHRYFPLKLALEYASENPEKYNALWSADIEKIERDMKNYYTNRLHFQQRIKPDNRLRSNSYR